MATIVPVLIAGFVSFWVFSDANARGMNAWGWAIFTLLNVIIALPVYLTIRKPKVGT